jgi:hypothetical protein
MRYARKTKTPEGYVLSAVLDLLAAERIWHRRMNTGATVVPETATNKRRFVRFGSTGMADVLATPVLFGITHLLWIECKANGKQSEDQKQFQSEVEQAGHSYLLVRSSDDLLDWLRKARFSQNV